MNSKNKEILLFSLVLVLLITGSIFSLGKITSPIAFGIAVYNIISSRYVFKNIEEKNKITREWRKVLENGKKIMREDFDIKYNFDDYIFTRFLRLIYFVIWSNGMSPQSILSMKSILNDYAVIQSNYQYE